MKSLDRANASFPYDIYKLQNDSAGELLESDMIKRQISRRNSMLTEDSHKRIPSNTKRGVEENASDSFKRLPSITKASTIFDGSDTELKKSAMKRMDSEHAERRNSIYKNNYRDNKENNTSGDLLRQSSVTRRNSVANTTAGDLRLSTMTQNDEESAKKPILSRKNSILGFFNKALKISDLSEKERKRRSIKTWDEFNKLYKLGVLIGEGAQGRVLLGTRLEDNQAVVIKIIEEHGIKSWNMYDKMPSSAYLLRMLNNSEEEGKNNTLFAHYEDHFYIEKCWVVITTYEDHEWIDLHDYIKQRQEPLEEADFLVIFKGAATAVSHLIALGFTHNDIKANNLLINRETLAIKLIDLCSCRVITTEPVSPTEFSGTLIYACPEVRTGNYFSPESQDVYALGILALFMIFGGKIPKTDLSSDVIDTSDIPTFFTSKENHGYSSKTIKLVQGMLHKKASKRLGILDVIDLL